ncbi:MAG: L-seryl-tRNA(Sec) selenium transferase [Anaerolineales bacterium]|nr:L-seryl-tRNA(Sec) selenium transferase [Anaerolineales bacterium]
MNTQSEYRKLPAIDQLLQATGVVALGRLYGRSQLTDAARAVLAEARAVIADGGAAPDHEAWPARMDAWLAGASAISLRPVINATGVIIHTNLGRAPLSEGALAALQRVDAGYSNLEYDLAAGGRGSRHDHARRALIALTGAEDAMVVNNCAAAVYLVLAALAIARDVLISRGQLVEIGGGFRIPDVLRASGARLVEVGTTNRTHLKDYQAALTAETTAIMRVHSSNFYQVGFVTTPTLEDLVKVAHSYGVILIDDLGSGALLDTTQYGLAGEPVVQQSIKDGADLVTFSGDKLVGGPQAGLIVGKQSLVTKLRNHPMARALRVDKLTLAALEATLSSYVRGRAEEEIPVWQMIAASPATVQARAVHWQTQLARAGIQATVIAGESTVGGGSLPGEVLPTMLLAAPARNPDAVAKALRQLDPPVICRIQHDHLLFDPRTVLPAQEEPLLTAIAGSLTIDR